LHKLVAVAAIRDRIGRAARESACAAVRSQGSIAACLLQVYHAVLDANVSLNPG